MDPIATGAAVISALAAVGQVVVIMRGDRRKGEPRVEVRQRPRRTGRPTRHPAPTQPIEARKAA